MSPASNQHGKIAALLTVSLGHHVLTHKLGAVYAAQTGFKLATNPDVVRAPDVGFVRQERLDAVGVVEGYWPGAPDLAIEVISPNDTYAEVDEKVCDWLEASSRMVVVVNPKRKLVTVYRSRADITLLTEHDYLDGGELVKGWKVEISSLFV